MEETRVKKYKDYRDSMIKEDAISIETVKNSETKHSRSEVESATTSALPISQVMGALEESKEEEAFLKKVKRQKLLKILLFVGIGVVVIGLLVLFGIIAFKGGK